MSAYPRYAQSNRDSTIPVAYSKFIGSPTACCSPARTRGRGGRSQPWRRGTGRQAWRSPQVRAFAGPHAQVHRGCRDLRVHARVCFAQRLDAFHRSSAGSRARGVVPSPTLACDEHDPPGVSQCVAQGRERRPRRQRRAPDLCPPSEKRLHCAWHDRCSRQRPMDLFPEPRHPDPGSSSSLERVERALALVAPHDAPVLLIGEPGSGRSVVARRLHQASPRRGGPLVQVDCRGLSTRGTAVKSLEDAMSTAAMGSILLEEIDFLAAPLQVRLTAWLETSRGSPRPRLLASTRRDLEDEVHRGTFREDLRSRIDVFEIRIPPLRDRHEDIPTLARQLLAESAARLHVASPLLPPDVERLLVGYSWPGNVRELRNAMERAVALSSGPAIDPTALPPRILAGTS